MTIERARQHFTETVRKAGKIPLAFALKNKTFVIPHVPFNSFIVIVPVFPSTFSYDTIFYLDDGDRRSLRTLGTALHPRRI